jgi:alpha-D-ribose 1-methylphosphonate 5-triphosphate diphosphatase
LNDRGELAVGLRADLVRVNCVDEFPVVQQVWQQGTRVF